MHRLWIAHNLRSGVRNLLRDRGSLWPALLALSLGIGASTVTASVVHSVLVDAFPFEDESSVVHFYIQTPDRPGRSAWYPAPEFVEYRAQNEVFSEVLGGSSMEVLYMLEGSAYRVRGTLIDPRALRTLGVRPILGRDMTDEDGEAGAPPTFLMSDRLWAERFGRDPSVLGTTLELNGTMRTLIAVLPPRFLLQGSDVFFPTTITAGLTDALVGGGGSRPLWVWTYARLAPGVSAEQAAANVNVIAQRLAKEYPDRYPERFEMVVVSLTDAYTAASLTEMVYILVGAVALLLLIACANVANLLLARATVREKEFALRASLGASRWRLVQQLLAESFVLSAAGTAVGGLLGFAGVRWVRAAIPPAALPTEMEIRFSTESLLATIAVAVLTTLLCGLAPALRASRGDLQKRLAGAGRGVGHSRAQGRWRWVLVSVQVSLAIVLLVGAGLMMRTLLALTEIDTGLQTENVLVGRFVFPSHPQPDAADRARFVDSVMEGIRTVPGVLAVSPSLAYPLARGPSWPVTVPGATPAEERQGARVEFVGDQYFRTVGLPLVSGRLLSQAEIVAERRLVVVNRRFSEEFLDGSDPIGRMVGFAPLDRMAGEPQLFEIVGVVGDAKNAGLEGEIEPQVFLPYTTGGIPVSAFALRSSIDPLALQNAVRERVWAVDRGVALTDTQSLEELRYRDALAEPSFGVGLLGSFAGIGLILAAIGVFSVVAYAVSLQTHEIGIRMALGAEASKVLRMVVLRGLRPVLAGAAVGVGVTYWLSRVMANQIYGVPTTDPWTIAAAVIVLVAVGMAACLQPARRATRVHPQVALRYE